MNGAKLSLLTAIFIATALAFLACEEKKKPEAQQAVAEQTEEDALALAAADAARAARAAADVARAAAGAEEDAYYDEAMLKAKANCPDKKIGSPKTIEAVFLKFNNDDVEEGYEEFACYAYFRLSNGEEKILGCEDTDLNVKEGLKKGIKVSITYQEIQRWNHYEFNPSESRCSKEDNLESVKILSEAGGGGVKVVESITYSSGNSVKFEYDDDNRIVKMVWTDGKTIALAYKGDELVDIKGLDFKKNGNTITMGSDYKTIIDKDGYIIKKESTGSVRSVLNYQYQAGNLIKITEAQTPKNDHVTEYKYDDKKSPFFNCKTPKWFLSHQFLDNIGLKNNITGFAYSNDFGELESLGYEFEYDSEGYPTKETTFAEGEEITTTFKYRSGKSTKGADQ